MDQQESLCFLSTTFYLVGGKSVFQRQKQWSLGGSLRRTFNIVNPSLDLFWVGNYIFVKDVSVRHLLWSSQQELCPFSINPSSADGKDAWDLGKSLVVTWEA